jgi:pilus assembly protein CpaF
MPTLTTHHRLLMNNDEGNKYNRDIGDINLLVSNITFDILKESPGLVADVANGNIERSVLETEIIKVIDRHKYHFGILRDQMIRKVFNFMFGYGELQKYIEDEEVSDIDGTKFNEFVIKRNGIRIKVPVNFGNEKIFDTYCKLIAIRNRGILNENDSHCRVADERYRLRINVSVKPRNVSGPAISIRKHRRKSYTLSDLVKIGMLNEEMALFFRSLAWTDVTILFCGKGATGKTTLMRSFVNILPEMERVLIAESDVEIYPDKPYCIEQRIKKPNEGGRPVTLRELIQDGLTMSLDTYCIGEIVGDEAWEFIKASFTGHRGLATTHSESAEDAFARLLTLSKGANIGESEKTIKEMMAKSIDIIIYLRDFKVSDVVEVTGYKTHTDEFQYNRLFHLKKRSEFIRCGEPSKRLKAKLNRREPYETFSSVSG